VQDYLREYGNKKVEANALIANPTAARALIREELWQWLSPAGNNQWIKENKSASAEASGHVEAITRMLAMFDSVGALYSPRRLEQAVTNGVASLPPAEN
jgi:ribosome-binding ATPase YchF (GTP1/OBG family)